MANLLNVSQRTVSRWERGEDIPGIAQQARLRDLGWEATGAMLLRIKLAVQHCPVSRSLTRTERLRLEALSPAALGRRPSMAQWIGQDLAPIACGILEEMLDDHELQRAITAGDISSITTITRSVFRTPEHSAVGTFRTTVSYFHYEGELYADSIGLPVPDHLELGYWPIPKDAV